MFIVLKRSLFINRKEIVAKLIDLYQLIVICISSLSNGKVCATALIDHWNSKTGRSS